VTWVLQKWQGSVVSAGAEVALGSRNVHRHDSMLQHPHTTVTTGLCIRQMIVLLIEAGKNIIRRLSFMLVTHEHLQAVATGTPFWPLPRSHVLESPA
jgi:hypothetical protein